MRWWDGALLGAGFGIAALLAESNGNVWIEPHYLKDIGPGSVYTRFVAAYAAVFVALAVLGWVAATPWRFLGAQGPLAAWALVPAALSLPVLFSALPYRPAIGRLASSPIGLVVCALTLIAVAAGARWLAVRGTPPAARRTARVTLAVLLVLATAVPYTLQHLPGQLASPPVALRAVGAVAVALGLALPFAGAIRGAGERSCTLPLAATASLMLVLATLAPRVPIGSGTSDGGSGRVPQRPSVLVVVADTLRADFVAGTGDDALTPNVARLVSDGVLFRAAHSAAPWTTPSFASMLSSEYPSSHRAGLVDPNLGFKHAMRDGAESLAEYLNETGYWTGAVLTNPSLSRRYRLDQGFDDYHNLLALRWYHPIAYFLQSNSIPHVVPWLHRLLSDERHYVPALLQSRRIVEAIDRGRASGRPFFLLAQYMDPHWPYVAPARFVGQGENPQHRVDDAYRAEVRHFDAGLGELLDALERRGFYEDLLVVFTSDHGEEILEARGDRPREKHGHTLFDEQLRVPFVFKLPGGRRAGEVREETVSTIDLAPTVAGVLGLMPAAGWVGRDLLAERVPRRVVRAEGMLIGPPQRAAIMGSYKLLAQTLPLQPETLRLFDRRSDPGERAPRPLAPGALPEEIARALLAELGSEADARDPSVPSEGIVPDRVLREQLEALGYVQ